MGQQQRLHRYHVDTVRNSLTRNMSASFGEVRDEVQMAFDDDIPRSVSGDWVAVPAYNTIMRVVCKVSNRFFVGLPLCRNPDWIDLNIQFALDIFKAASIINLFPDFLKPVVGNILSPANAVQTKRALRDLGDIIQDRLDKEDAYGPDWADRPNDLISWLIHDNPGGKFRTVTDLVMRILSVNMASIHSTSIEFTNTLFYLAIQPSHVINTLREEIDTVVKEHGWSKISIGYLWKLDSFMKETARMASSNGLAVERKVMKEFALSDGTVIPVGTVLTVPSLAIHHDEVGVFIAAPETLTDFCCIITIAFLDTKRNFNESHVFKPFRFSDMRTNERIKHQMVTPNAEYIFFGAGRHACPGRFFAVNELKILVAHTLMTYDLKLEDNTKMLPEPQWLGYRVSPSRTAKVLFRRRNRNLKV
ncbi:hypothetical protein D9758_011873 [Tetrapyrgos nigripes]|uniref:Cytochrome P450 n=1 Tax=Tetrapyrgos nigripes TaxID=182062 RepID=A0A8H5CRI7_9AGAR|nr:hypothetical protein D9758_011873 [Tetrapyrgos nigripes]